MYQATWVKQKKEHVIKCFQAIATQWWGALSAIFVQLQHKKNNQNYMWQLLLHWTAHTTFNGNFVTKNIDNVIGRKPFNIQLSSESRLLLLFLLLLVGIHSNPTLTDPSDEQRPFVSALVSCFFNSVHPLCFLSSSPLLRMTCPKHFIFCFSVMALRGVSMLWCELIFSRTSKFDILAN